MSHLALMPSRFRQNQFALVIQGAAPADVQHLAFVNAAEAAALGAAGIKAPRGVAAGEAAVLQGRFSPDPADAAASPWTLTIAHADGERVVGRVREGIFLAIQDAGGKVEFPDGNPDSPAVVKRQRREQLRRLQGEVAAMGDVFEPVARMPEPAPSL
ncbi:hypothetical protein LAZ40_11460 [Cereibacter sphaeroides]|uniref:hypothetical protein n=1 Tax=Cereibacter sphaeroides TaxID=1063 RepID=UPI001F457999|nr:hypothetical protein [Cereibacter sphaeroides]MCE6959635.1 hypothetical protein [Cereibacter sphaeroides]MCE6974504.1 hypothetical protein [Cereibacter sphaeroides]